MQHQTTAPAPTVAQLLQDLKTERARCAHWRTMTSNEIKHGEQLNEQIHGLTRQISALDESIATLERGHMSHTPPQYYIEHPSHGVIMVKHGEPGYHKTDATPERAVDLNLLQGLTPYQTRAAETCSMFNNWENFASIADNMRREAKESWRADA